MSGSKIELDADGRLKFAGRAQMYSDSDGSVAFVNSEDNAYAKGTFSDVDAKGKSSGEVGVFGPDRQNAAGNLYVGSSNQLPDGNISYFDLASDNQVGPTTELRKARGTQAALADVQPGDVLGSYEFHGYSGDVYFHLADIRAVVGNEPFTPGSEPPTKVQIFNTRANQPQVLAAEIDERQNVAFAGTVRAMAVPFASLPVNPQLGALATVTDSDTDVWGDVIGGGGSHVVLGFFNGTNWTVAGK